MMTAQFARNGPAPLLHLDRVGRTYHMGEVAVEVLRDVTIEIASSEILAIVGPSGSGKSTLLNLIGGLDKPTTGAVWFRERDRSQLSSRELTLYRRDTVGFVFQF